MHHHCARTAPETCCRQSQSFVCKSEWRRGIVSANTMFVSAPQLAKRKWGGFVIHLSGDLLMYSTILASSCGLAPGLDSFVT